MGVVWENAFPGLHGALVGMEANETEEDQETVVDEFLGFLGPDHHGGEVTETDPGHKDADIKPAGHVLEE